MTSTDKINLIGRTPQIETLRNARTRLTKKNGSIVFVPSESGYGKTALLQVFEQDCTQSGIMSVLVECQSPVGNFQVGNLQPLHPFVRVLEELTKRESKSAQKKLAFNIGMSVLSVLPFIGDAIYAVKEIGKDVKEFKKDKDGDKKVSNAVGEVFELLKNYTVKSPLVLLLDDMQWADADSVDLLGHFAAKLDELPIMLVVSYRQSVVQDRLAPLLSLLKQYPANGKSILKIDIPAFTLPDMNSLCSSVLSSYKQNKEFEKWLFEKTSGIPQIVVEYLHYFDRVSPFDSSGKLTDEFLRGEIVPASVHAAFSKLAEQLTEEDRNILSICSAEGNECTAFVVSKLMNTDVVTTIKKLRFLQQRTGIIRSLGAKTKYGVKTTVYQFGQTFYQEHFHELLEFEEKAAIHDHIAALLQKQYDEAPDTQTKNLIAPYLAAHHAESGNEPEAQKMLIISAQVAADMGSAEIVHTAQERLVEMFHTVEEGDQPLRNEMNAIMHHVQNDIDDEFAVVQINEIDIDLLQREIVELYHAGKFTEAIQKAEHSLIDIPDNADKARIVVLLSKAHLEAGELLMARTACSQAIQLLLNHPNPETHCLALNTSACIAISLGEHNLALENLRQAASLCNQLSNEFRLLTITNISTIVSRSSPQEATRYKKAAKQLSKSLHFTRFAEDAFGN
ncbi:MAG: AAA family ATPase [Ignavibacteria bacterium]|nr:AAA family ATPase [Ignavibacteria bacterium]